MNRKTNMHNAKRKTYMHCLEEEYAKDMQKNAKSEEDKEYAYEQRGRAKRKKKEEEEYAKSEKEE